MTVKEMIIDSCLVHYPEADGLCNIDCGCSFEDIQPCSSGCMNCKPAKWDKDEEIYVEITIQEQEEEPVIEVPVKKRVKVKIIKDN